MPDEGFTMTAYFFNFFTGLSRIWRNAPTPEQLVRQQTQDVINRYPEYRKRLYYSKDQLQLWRDQRLRALLTYAKHHSPWYRKQFATINVDKFTEKNLCDIPPVNKKILMEHWNQFVTKKQLSLKQVERHIAKKGKDIDTLYLLDQYHVLATSGSSGTRGVFVYNWDEWINYYTNIVRYQLYNEEGTELLFLNNQEITVAQVIVTNTVYAMYANSVSFQLNNIRKLYFPVTLPMRDIIRHLNQAQPDILQAVPSVMYKLCQEALDGQLSINPKVVYVAAEPLYKPIRELIHKTWDGVSIFNTLGSSEGYYGINCRANMEEMHLNSDACIIEPVDQYGYPVSKGIKSQKIYLTNLFNYTLPLIRYELADQLVFLDKECSCGIKHQLIAEPEGRPEFDFYYDGIYVHHLIFVTHLLLEKNIQEYQVMQTANGAHIKLQVNGPINQARLIKELSSELRQLGIVQPQITLENVKNFDYPLSGKLRRFLKNS